jgi:hypothetical protein
MEGRLKKDVKHGKGATTRKGRKDKRRVARQGKSGKASKASEVRQDKGRSVRVD